MKLFILDVAQLTSAYHSGGGLVIVARDIERAKEIIDGYSKDTEPTQDEWDSATIYDLYGDYEEETYFFPNAGCC